MRGKGKAILACVVAAIFWLAASIASFDVGMRYGLSRKADPAAMADLFGKGKATFCGMSEDARLYVCPAMRKAISLPGGAALVYICDATGRVGFVSFVRVPPEVRARAIGKMLEAGLRTGSHCATKTEEILWIREGTVASGKTTISW